MKKRILAWVMLIGFVLLFANIAFIGYKRELSLVVYLIILVYYVFNVRKFTVKKDHDDQNDNSV